MIKISSLVCELGGILFEARRKAENWQFSDFYVGMYVSCNLVILNPYHVFAY